MVDNRLTNYVEQQLNNGYSLEQIRAYLLQNRYKEKDVDAAIALVEDKLAKSSQISVLAGYVKEYLGQGYTQQQIEQGLLQQGYSPVIVQLALQKAAKKKFTLPTISKKTVLIIFLVLLMTITLVAIAWFFVNIEKSEEQAVDFVIRVDVETLAPGDTLYITNEFKHFPDDREYPITIYYTISDRDTLTREDSWQISFDRDDPLERTTKYGLQRNIAEDDYEVYAKMNYGSTSVQSYAYFTISLDEAALEEAVEEAAENEQMPVPDQTQEKQKTEEVIAEEIIEDVQVTSEASVVTSDDYKNYAAAKELAGQDAEAAAVYCTAVNDPGQKDSCYNTVARTSEQKEYCADIISDPTKDACYIYFAFNLGDYTVCEAVANEFIQQSCKQLEQVAQLQT